MWVGEPRLQDGGICARHRRVEFAGSLLYICNLPTTPTLRAKKKKKNASFLFRQRSLDPREFGGLGWNRQKLYQNHNNLASTRHSGFVPALYKSIQSPVRKFKKNPSSNSLKWHSLSAKASTSKLDTCLSYMRQYNDPPDAPETLMDRSLMCLCSCLVHGSKVLLRTRRFRKQHFCSTNFLFSWDSSVDWVWPRGLAHWAYSSSSFLCVAGPTIS